MYLRHFRCLDYWEYSDFYVVGYMDAGVGSTLKLQQSQVENKAGLIDCFNALFSTYA